MTVVIAFLIGLAFGFAMALWLLAAIGFLM